MKVELNHTIVAAKNAQESAHFLTELLGLPPAKKFFHFLVVKTTNGVSLDYLETSEPYEIQHYAFLVSEEVFDAAYAKIKARQIPYWADPRAARPGEINTNDGGRGIYFKDPGGHYLELITRPYGG